jgi:FkbM family methyltransferase
MFKKLQYHISVYIKFGFKSIYFLSISKFLKNKLGPRHISGIKYPLYLSNYNVDVSTLFQIFFAKEYEITLNSSPLFIIDCGANIGLSAIYYANIYPLATIIAIEPDRNNFKYLEINTAQYKNVVCLNKAIWSNTTQIEIIDTGRGNWGLQTRETFSNNLSNIEGICIDDLLSTFEIDKIDILKIDIEGAEKELFSNNYENWLPKTKVIAIELHDFLEKGISDNFYKAIEGLKYKKSCKGENIFIEFI